MQARVRRQPNIAPLNTGHAIGGDFTATKLDERWRNLALRFESIKDAVDAGDLQTLDFRLGLGRQIGPQIKASKI